MIIRHLKTAWALIFVLALSVGVAAHPTDFQKKGSYEPHSGQSIFDLLQLQELVEMTLVTELDSLVSVRNSADYRPGILTYKDGMGVERSYDVKAKPRGKFRRRVCDFPPLKLKFSKDQLEAAGLAKHNDLKLVTHCLNDEPYDESLVLKEYLAYKMYNELTPNSFRVQLVRITYQDKHNKLNKIKQYGFLIEDEDELAQRLGGEICDKCMGVPAEQIRPAQEKVLALYQFLVGNLDYDLHMKRNVELIKMADGTYIPVPYDFDFSVLVGAPYLRPNSDLGQTKSMERIYVGQARGADDVKNTITYFKTKRNTLLATIRSFPYLKKQARFEMELYVESFFDQLENQASAQTMIFRSNEKMSK